MRKLTIGIIIAGITFIIGVTVASVRFIKRRSQPVPPAQTVSKPSQSSTFRDGDLIINPHGWPIPDVSKYQISERRSKLKDAEYPVKVYRTGYFTFTSEREYIPKANYEGVDPVRKWSLYDLSTYDIDKRKFCYRMKVWDVPLPDEGGGVGVVYYITYYDLDGDGKFESWDTKGDRPHATLRMPQWVK